jgi:hypothetical protein
MRHRWRVVASGALTLFSKSNRKCGDLEMTTIALSATPKGNGFQATVTFPDGVSISSAETYPTITEAITAAALKLLDMPERLERFDPSEIPIQASPRLPRHPSHVAD